MMIVGRRILFMENNGINIKVTPLKTNIHYNLDLEDVDYSLLVEHLLKSVDHISGDTPKKEILLGISEFIYDNFDKPYQAANIIKGGIIGKEDS